ncbi:non-structural maintenance of chromosomes element 1 homolog [Tribolium castaneum]|uniref:Non-structural maintenance of chromosomes element 1 homolog n=1 Tax=Tribolium castaneum TaxID=7070 RepID=A0A139WF15_TRICA|nr:PREDICTED: non-structural maintenance of chromosomes element 1 homolog [Tribolium castaneum]KYB26512.1 Non-structural maintenance of chromosomes element 1 homolog-like Protein [Tribolium castaneum]|eukprot:XP_975042.1 PREDICTED: non-structural maintenance of chromosomes element 1 homolog [Tribolium castaneum]
MAHPLSERHRYFIQFMLTNGLVTVDKALKFFGELSPDQNQLVHLKSLIIEINRAINLQYFKIATSVCEVTGDSVFVWLNTKNDELSKQQIGFSPVELEYFHAIMQEIITSDNHELPYPRCINITSTLVGTLTRENGEKALMKWIRGGYFVKVEQFVYLGARTILEFTTYLRTNTENCTCSLCSELVFRGESCQSCFNTFHTFCIQKYLQNQHRCPSCRTDWEGANTNTSMDVDSEEGAG